MDSAGGLHVPLCRAGRPCGRRCGKLYLPPGGTYFGCRVCYDLSYASQREDLANRMIRNANKLRYEKLGGRGDDGLPKAEGDALGNV